MKIEWLNDEMTEARLTRGLLRRRVALVRYDAIGCWWFYASKDPVEDDINWDLAAKRGKEIKRRSRVERAERNWHQPRPTPRARLLAVKR